MISGLEKTQKSRFVVASLVRDCQQTLNSIFNFIEGLEEYCCSEVPSIFIENDSVDRTKDILSKYKGTDNNINLSLDTLNKTKYGDEATINRAAYLSELRNKYLDIVYTKYRDYDYLVVVDGDTKYIALDGIFSSLECPDDNWGCIGANGIDIHPVDKEIYYDTWALTIVNKNMYYMHRSILPIPKTQKFFSVDSCFGGAALYKINILANNNILYSFGQADGKPISEQAVFGLKLKELGYSSYINTGWCLIR